MKLVVSLDVYNLHTVKKIIKSIGNNKNIIYKIGHPLFLRTGESCINLIYNETISSVFLDFKWHDIKNTVIESCVAVKRFRPYIVTIHSTLDKDTIKEAKNVLGKTKLIAVTKLTDQEDDGTILSLAEYAVESGADGVVCSGREINILKEYLPEAELVVPGIRPSWYNKKDEQKRIVTPKEAKERGADYIVIGRPIINSKNPGESVKRIEEEIK